MASAGDVIRRSYEGPSLSVFEFSTCNSFLGCRLRHPRNVPRIAQTTMPRNCGHIPCAPYLPDRRFHSTIHVPRALMARCMASGARSRPPGQVTAPDSIRACANRVASRSAAKMPADPEWTKSESSTFPSVPSLKRTCRRKSDSTSTCATRQGVAGRTAGVNPAGTSVSPDCARGRNPGYGLRGIAPRADAGIVFPNGARAGIQGQKRSPTNRLSTYEPGYVSGNATVSTLDRSKRLEAKSISKPTTSPCSSRSTTNPSATSRVVLPGLDFSSI
jgi:hypothetical protein